jgi:hypothetical protein
MSTLAIGKFDDKKKVDDKYIVKRYTSNYIEPTFALSLSCSQDNLARVMEEKIIVRAQL